MEDDPNNPQEPNTSNDNGNKDDLEKIIQERVAAELADIKGKLDKAYEQRDEAVRKAVNYEEEKKQQEIKRLEEEGKIKEASDMRIAELQEKLSLMEKKNTELTRDSVVRDALKGLEFRNETAADFAYRDVVSQLVQNENGQWVHRTGASIKDFIETFRKDENKDFLFKPKQSSGTGGTPPKPTGGFDTNKPLSEMTLEEQLAAAESGAFDGGHRWT